MNIIDNILLDVVSGKAEASPRLRMNYNFHEKPDDKVQRLLNALEPGTELPIHRHTHTDEMYILLRGKLNVKTFDEKGNLLNMISLSPVEGKYGVNISAGEWHTVEVLEKGTVIFEIKEGPYTPLGEKDILNQ